MYLTRFLGFGVLSFEVEYRFGLEVLIQYIGPFERCDFAHTLSPHGLGAGMTMGQQPSTPSVFGKSTG